MHKEMVIITIIINILRLPRFLSTTSTRFIDT